jgi:Rrf2 family protein
MVDVAVNSNGKPVSIKSIAARQNISEAYLEQVFSILKKAGFLKAERGAYGGFKIIRPLDKITAGEIIRSLEGQIETVNCSGCSNQEFNEKKEISCATYPFWNELNILINNYMDNITLKTLIDNNLSSGL